MLKTSMTASLLRTSGLHTDAQIKAMGPIYQSLQQQASIFELYRRASDPRDLLRLHGFVGALDEASAQRHHGGLPLITHVSPQDTNKCASSQTLP
jgi:hypothetical protein